MANLLTCRVCLATNVKLYNMHGYGLHVVYENVTGISVTIPDRYPHYICTFCKCLLLKSNSFKETCIRSHELLKSVTTKLTQKHIASLYETQPSVHSFVTTPVNAFATNENQKTKVLPDKNPKIISNLEYVNTSEADNQIVKFEPHDGEYCEFEIETMQTVDIETLETAAFDANIDQTGTKLDNENVNIIILGKEQQLEEFLIRKDPDVEQNCIYQCEVCLKEFKNSTSCRRHVARHEIESEVKFVCSSCKSIFKNAEAMTYHQDASEDRTCDPLLSYCPHCGECFETREVMKEHLKQHKTPVTCEECNKTFSQKRYLAVHRNRVHCEAKEKKRVGYSVERSLVACEVCGKKYTPSSMVHHMTSHTGEKPYQCMECPKRFRIYHNLQIHIRTHTGESPFECPECPKAFKHKAALNRHIRVHTGVKPYQCPQCLKAFTQSNSMKLHIRTVHLKMPTPYPRNKKTVKPDEDNYNIE